MVKHAKAGNDEGVWKEAMDSKWGKKQTPKRAKGVVDLMKQSHAGTLELAMGEAKKPLDDESFILTADATKKIGPAALDDLVAKTTPESADARGEVVGPGGGKADLVPKKVENSENNIEQARLSNGEYILPKGFAELVTEGQLKKLMAAAENDQLPKGEISSDYLMNWLLTA